MKVIIAILLISCCVVNSRKRSSSECTPDYGDFTSGAENYEDNESQATDYCEAAWRGVAGVKVILDNDCNTDDEVTTTPSESSASQPSGTPPSPDTAKWEKYCEDSDNMDKFKECAEKCYGEDEECSEDLYDCFKDAGLSSKFIAAFASAFAYYLF